MKKRPYCLYVLKSQQDGSFYIGFTTDLHRRLTEQFHGQSDATAPRRPFDLIYCEYHAAKGDAPNAAQGAGGKVEPRQSGSVHFMAQP